MKKELELLKDKSEQVNVTMKFLDESYIDKIMELQNIIIEGLEDKQFYSASSENEFLETIRKKGKIIGIVTNDDELVAMGVYIKNDYDEHNYGYDIGIQGEELLKVGQIESTVVRKEFRGNKLQQLICKEIEKIAIENNTPIICATASPYNKFSVNTFIDLGYEVKADKLKYGGLRRYVLCKNINN